VYATQLSVTIKQQHMWLYNWYLSNTTEMQVYYDSGFCTWEPGNILQWCLCMVL